MKFGMVIPTLGPLAAGAGAMEAQITIAQRAEAFSNDALAMREIRSWRAFTHEHLTK